MFPGAASRHAKQYFDMKEAVLQEKKSGTLRGVKYRFVFSGAMP